MTWKYIVCLEELRSKTWDFFRTEVSAFAKKGKIQFKLFSYLLSNKLGPKALRSFPEGVRA